MNVEASSWSIGDKCLIVGQEYTFGCINPVCDQGSVVVFDETGDFHGCHIDELSKPETPVQKEEREKLEAAYDLYVASQESLGVLGYESLQQFSDDKLQVRFWLSIVDKTKYRKEN